MLARHPGELNTMDDKKEAWEPHLCGHNDKGQDTMLALQLGSTFLKVASELLCKESAQSAFEQIILIIATGLAINGTAIDAGSQEAHWETERVLKGIESRLMGQLKYCFDKSNELGMTKEKAKATFEQFAQTFGWDSTKQ
jgi:hypothetical protein